MDVSNAETLAVGITRAKQSVDSVTPATEHPGEPAVKMLSVACEPPGTRLPTEQNEGERPFHSN